jgi:hypothetical protein
MWMKTEFNKPDFINSNKAFERAIKKEILSDDETRPDFAGNFMYMHSQDGIDYFKNINTRKYGHDKATILKSLER